MVKTIQINKSDCIDEDIFEQLVDECGLKISGETLIITGALTNDFYERQVQLNKEDLESSLWSEIKMEFNFDHTIESINIAIEEVELTN